MFLSLITLFYSICITCIFTCSSASNAKYLPSPKYNKPELNKLTQRTSEEGLCGHYSICDGWNKAQLVSFLWKINIGTILKYSPSICMGSVSCQGSCLNCTPQLVLLPPSGQKIPLLLEDYFKLFSSIALLLTNQVALFCSWCHQVLSFVFESAKNWCITKAKLYDIFMNFAVTMRQLREQSALMADLFPIKISGAY